jgi:hypothetical protein
MKASWLRGSGAGLAICLAVSCGGGAGTSSGTGGAAGGTAGASGSAGATGGVGGGATAGGGAAGKGGAGGSSLALAVPRLWPGPGELSDKKYSVN